MANQRNQMCYKRFFQNQNLASVIIAVITIHFGQHHRSSGEFQKAVSYLGSASGSHHIALEELSNRIQFLPELDLQHPAQRLNFLP